MKIVHINTYDQLGGASLAANRLVQAQLNQGEDVTFLTLYKKGKDDYTHTFESGKIGHYKSLFKTYYEKAYFTLFEKSKEVRFAFSAPVTGFDVTKNSFFQEADIINLHWINNGFLSIDSLKKIAKSGKPVVWTLHDMWTFTGGCHYAGSCRAYCTQCHNCPFLKHPSEKDLSNRIWKNKNELFSLFPNLSIVSPSIWLKKEAEASGLISSHNIEVHHIPYAIDLNQFSPLNKIESKKRLGLNPEKLTILFGAVKISDKRKGIAYFIEAINLLKKGIPDIEQHFEFAVFGRPDEEQLRQFPVSIKNLGVLSGPKPLQEAYSAADAFIIPSLEDNLPNTVIESLACGTPVIAFDTGGIPDMVEHLQTGYIAESRNSEKLAEGMKWLLNLKEQLNPLYLACREKAVKNYNFELISGKYVELYKSLISKKHSR